VPVAFEYGLHAGANYHFWLPAYEASVSRYSPGILLSLDTMRLGSAEGFRVFDYGFEGEPYKKYFCNRSQTVLEGVAHRQGYAGAMAAAFSLAGADVALAAGGRFVSAGLGLSVRRRWASIDACETTVVGRARGIAAAAAAALNKARPQSAVSALGAMLIL
jgi:CelD/BcsL family acetyltransferase involved in cellulose biosynthesis